MSFRTLIILRHLSSSRCLLRPTLSPAYKSQELWDCRFNCDLLSAGSDLIQKINNKITSGIDLTNLEIDVFTNIALADKDDVSQLQEAVANLGRFRKTIYANTQLPSTAHAICRLFLDSDRLSAITTLLEKRIEYGVFPDSFALNLLLDRAIQTGEFALGSRLASLIMLQEEFGLNAISDNLALYSVSKYIESKTDFSDWSKQLGDDGFFFGQSSQQEAPIVGVDSKEENAEEEEEDEEDAEYIRVPFLRNPYFDNHFDLTNPRMICGKTLAMLGLQLINQQKEPTLGVKCKLVGDILQGSWSETKRVLSNHKELNLTSNSELNEALKYYIENFHGIESKLNDDEKKSLFADLERLPSDGQSLSEDADARHKTLGDVERQDIERLRVEIGNWSKARQACQKAEEDLEKRRKLIEEIRLKKKELKEQEEFLYFFDKLKKRNLTRLEYD